VTYSWKTLDKGYNFVLYLMSIEGLHKKLWASKVVRVPILKISRLLTWESWDKMTFRCRPSWQGIKNSISGKVVASSSLGRGESYEFMFAYGSSVHQKCSNYTLTNLLFGLCKSVWIIDLLVTRLSSPFKALAHPSTLEMLWTRECTPIPYPCWFHLWIRS